jgi:putative membrane protein
LSHCQKCQTITFAQKIEKMEKENFTEQELIVRDYLARQRTYLANDRTLLSFIRTSLYFLVSGTALMEVNALEHIRELGYLAFALSLATLIIGVYSFFRVKKKLKKHYYQEM